MEQGMAKLREVLEQPGRIDGIIDRFRPQLEQGLALLPTPVQLLVQARGGVDALKDPDFRAQVQTAVMAALSGGGGGGAGGLGGFASSLINKFG